MIIKELRQSVSISRETLAAVLGISHKTVKRWESGQGKPSRLAERETKRFMDEIKARGSDEIL